MPRWTSRPIPVAIGERVVPVSELRVRDRDDLCAYLESYFGPLVATLDPASPDYPRQLEWAYDHADAWPPGLGTPLADAAIYDEPTGLALFLALCCRGISADEARGLAATITDDELAGVERAAWRPEHDVKAAVLRLIDAHLGLPDFAPAPEPPDGEPITWERAVADLVCGGGRGGPGWASPEAVGDLTLTQFRLARSGAEPEESGDALPADPELRDRVCAARRKFFGIPDAPPEAPPEPTFANMNDLPPDYYNVPPPGVAPEGACGEWEEL